MSDPNRFLLIERLPLLIFVLANHTKNSEPGFTGPLHGASFSYVISETWQPLSFDFRPMVLRPRFSPGLPFRFYYSGRVACSNSEVNQQIC